MSVERDGLARSLRSARENLGISQQAAADQVGLSRTVVAQIELGNRSVTEDELERLARLYRRPLAELSDRLESSLVDEILAALLEIEPEPSQERIKRELQSFFDLCVDATSLERSVGRATPPYPPHYDLPAPRSVADAIRQGESVATQERQQLGTGATLSVAKVSHLVRSQGLRVSAIELPTVVHGLFVRHRSVDPAIIVPRKDVAWQRFNLAEEYAHALFERGRSAVVISSLYSAEELVDTRARAFASAFLLPPAGVEQFLRAVSKGGPSRRAHALINRKPGAPVRAEVRQTAGSQTITFCDVVALARHFGTAYQATVYRLEELGVLSQSDGNALLTPKQEQAAQEYAALFTESRKERLLELDGTLELKTEIIDLAIEAYRRQAIDKAGLSAYAEKLQIPELSKTKLLALAEVAR